LEACIEAREAGCGAGYRRTGHRLTKHFRGEKQPICTNDSSLERFDFDSVFRFLYAISFDARPFTMPLHSNGVCLVLARVVL